MKKTLEIMVLTILIGFVVGSCNSETKHKEQPPISDLKIIDLITVSSDFKASYTVQKKEDLSSFGVVKKQLRISIPSSLDKSEVENCIKHVLIDFYNKNKPNGISILVYEQGDNIESAYSVAMGEFAPFGEWDKVRVSVPLSSYKLKIEFKDSYFNPKIETIGIGSTVRLYKDKLWSRKEKKMIKAKDVPLSKSAREWTKEYILVSIPNNSEAKIIDIHKEKLTDGSEFIRYLLDVDYKGKKYEGWVHSEECFLK